MTTEQTEQWSVYLI